jgi:hypothetical protein
MKFVGSAVVLVAIAGFAAGCSTDATSLQVNRQPARATADLLRVPRGSSNQLTPTELARSVKPPGTADLSPPPSAARGTVGSVGRWTLSLMLDKGRYLLIGTSTSGCTSLWKLKVEEDSRTVVISPQLSSPSDPHKACPSIEIGHLWLINLGSPLGGRSLLHPKVTYEQPGCPPDRAVPKPHELTVRVACP